MIYKLRYEVATILKSAYILINNNQSYRNAYLTEFIEPSRVIVLCLGAIVLTGTYKWVTWIQGYIINFLRSYV